MPLNHVGVGGSSTHGSGPRKIATWFATGERQTEAQRSLSPHALLHNAVEAIEPDSLTAGTVFTDLPEWDSLAALSVLAMVDAEYETEISGKELRGCKTLQDLFDVVRSKT